MPAGPEPSLGVPEGYRLLEVGGPYFRLLGPVHARSGEGGRWVIGLRFWF